jgi:threonine/homoserine/homoserine lactone efflux protein
VGLHLWAFLGVSLVVIIVPGPDTAIVTKNAVLHGRTAALGTALGVNAGLLTWTIAAALGIAAAVRASAVAFTALKLIGAAYLVWLGIEALRAARRQAPSAAAGPAGGAGAAEERPRMGARRGFRQGLLSDLGNPKIGVFFTSLLPQFVVGHASVLWPSLLLGGVFVLMTLVWLCGYAVLASRISAVLTRPAVKSALDAATGAVLVAVGIRLALERR